MGLLNFYICQTFKQTFVQRIISFFSSKYEQIKKCLFEKVNIDLSYISDNFSRIELHNLSKLLVLVENSEPVSFVHDHPVPWNGDLKKPRCRPRCREARLH